MLAHLKTLLSHRSLSLVLPLTSRTMSSAASTPSIPGAQVAIFASGASPPPASYIPDSNSNSPAGCFWGTEHIFLKHYPISASKGILKTAVGYTGGKESSQNPSYKEVCSGATQHAEAVRIEFDPATVEYAELVEFFYRTHDPTTVNRQGGDVGTQYRSAIFTTTPEQAEVAQRVTDEVQAKHFTTKVGARDSPLASPLDPRGPWWDAEDYHQLYLFKNPSGYQCPTHRLHW
ncbi:Peptide methionine sulfoxide reductase [Mycena kentingensis (nom. inval.)]|nr:Peptide methionine sulfoxide reductase [Mycena kentingensis (nom. inval.)]